MSHSFKYAVSTLRYRALHFESELKAVNEAVLRTDAQATKLRNEVSEKLKEKRNIEEALRQLNKAIELLEYSH